jgi:hypothetical protein
MTKHFFLFLLMAITSGLASAQGIRFYDVDGKELKQEEFLKKRNPRHNLALSFQEGRATITRLVKREKTGHLQQDSLQQLFQAIKTATGHSPANKLLIINYADTCPIQDPRSTNTAATKERHEAYRSGIAKIQNSAQFYIHSDQSKNHCNNLLNWIPDPGSVVQRSFFEYNYPYGGYVIIRPDGRYYAYYGEYDLTLLLKKAGKMAK